MIIAHALSKWLYDTGFIDGEEREVVCYGIEHLLMNFTGICIILSIGFLFGRVAEALAMAFSLFPLRKYAGGFHAESLRNCIIISTSIIFISFVTTDKININAHLMFIMAILSILVIAFFSPVECKNKRLDDLEKKIYKTRVTQVLGAEIILAVFACKLHFLEAVKGLVMGWCVVSVAILAGVIKVCLDK